MADNNKSFMLTGCDALEDSMLKSILLFNNYNTKDNKKDLLPMAIFSIIIHGRGEYNIDNILEILRERFALDYKPDDIIPHITKLSSKGYITQTEDKYKDCSKDGGTFFSHIEEETQALITGIIARITKVGHISINQNDTTKIKRNIRNALSIYFQLYGYSFWGLKQKEDVNNIPNAVEIACRELPNKLGRALVGALADVINNPQRQEKEILEKWARAYVAMEVLSLDPSLRNFKVTKLRTKIFIIDTDVALNALASKARYSAVYRQMIKSLIKAGCQLLIPSTVIDEIQDHIDAAKKRYSYNGSQWTSIPDEVLETIDANIFVEDYVKLVRSDFRDLQFQTYIENFSDPENPQLLIDKLKTVFSHELRIMGEDEIEPINDNIKQKLADEIESKTMMSAKGSKRNSEKNAQIAETDALLYLTIQKLNRDERGNNKPLSQKAYLLTTTKKTIDCAKKLGIYDKNIICSPLALAPILQEIGLIEGAQINPINLFENPFLTYTAELIWPQVKPLLEAGAQLKYKDIHRLRIDVDANIDSILTCETLKDKAAEAQRLTERGYMFANDLLSAQKAIEDKEAQILDKENVIASLKEQISRLQKATSGNKIRIIKNVTPQRTKRKSKRGKIKNKRS